ncbi:MAG: hypothetical protein KDE35_15780 [Geminicoccaceae bacterium]|nr:hypothetical protein [Geminicoccaceae bacterium]
MLYVALAVSILAFALALRVLDAVRVMRAPDLDDEVKEQRVQAASIALFGRFFAVTWRFAAAVAAGALPVLLVAWAGWVSLDAMLEAMLSLEVILAGTVAFVLVLVLGR